MRLLHLAASLQGGAGRVIADLARAQAHARHDVTIVTSVRTPAPALEELRLAGVTVVTVHSDFDRSPASQMAVVEGLDTLVPIERAPRVLHTHDAVATVAALLFAGARRKAVGLVQTLHGWGRLHAADQVATDLTVLKLLDRVVVPSAHAARRLAALGVPPSRIACVPYGVAQTAAASSPDEDLAAIEMTRARRQGRFVVAWAGTEASAREAADLLDAVAMLADEPLLCVMLTSPSDGAVADLVRRRHPGGRVLVCPDTTGGRVVVAAADLVLVPDAAPAHVRAAIGAFGDGTLVAVADGPDLIELVQGGATGGIFGAGGSSALADVIRRFVRVPNPTRRALREQARAAFVRQFTLAAMVDHYQRIYHALPDVPRSGRRRRAEPAA